MLSVFTQLGSGLGSAVMLGSFWLGKAQEVEVQWDPGLAPKRISGICPFVDFSETCGLYDREIVSWDEYFANESRFDFEFRWLECNPGIESGDRLLEESAQTKYLWKFSSLVRNNYNPYLHGDEVVRLLKKSDQFFECYKWYGFIIDSRGNGLSGYPYDLKFEVLAARVRFELGPKPTVECDRAAYGYEVSLRVMRSAAKDSACIARDLFWYHLKGGNILMAFELLYAGVSAPVQRSDKFVHLARDANYNIISVRQIADLAKVFLNKGDISRYVKLMAIAAEKSRWELSPQLFDEMVKELKVFAHQKYNLLHAFLISDVNRRPSPHVRLDREVYVHNRVKALAAEYIDATVKQMIDGSSQPSFRSTLETCKQVIDVLDDRECAVEFFMQQGLHRIVRRLGGKDNKLKNANSYGLFVLIDKVLGALNPGEINSLKLKKVHSLIDETAVLAGEFIDLLLQAKNTFLIPVDIYYDSSRLNNLKERILSISRSSAPIPKLIDELLSELSILDSILDRFSYLMAIRSDLRLDPYILEERDEKFIEVVGKVNRILHSLEVIGDLSNSVPALHARVQECLKNTEDPSALLLDVSRAEEFFRAGKYQKALDLWEGIQRENHFVRFDVAISMYKAGLRDRGIELMHDACCLNLNLIPEASRLIYLYEGNAAAVMDFIEVQLKEPGEGLLRSIFAKKVLSSDDYDRYFPPEV